MIDTDRLQFNDYVLTSTKNEECREEAIANAQTFISGATRTDAINAFYDITDKEFSLAYDLTKSLQNELNTIASIGQYKCVVDTPFDDLKRYFHKVLKSNVKDKEYSKFNDKEIMEKDNEIDRRINDVLLNGYRDQLQAEHPNYDLTRELDIMQLYLDLYNKVTTNFVQFTVDLQELSKVSTFIDLYNNNEKLNKQDNGY